MIFTLGMNSNEMNEKFQAGVKLWNEGKAQEGADLWMDLAELGHLDSIEQLVYVFFDQKDFVEAKTYISYAKDQNKPIVLYLKARLIEESVGFEESIESFKFAINAGSPNACQRMFNASIFNEWLDDAIYYLEKLKEYPDYFDDPLVTYSMEDIEQELNDLKVKLEAEKADDDGDSSKSMSDDQDELELDGCQGEEWVEVIEAFLRGDDNEFQEIQDTYPRTIEAFVNLRECGLFEIWAEWSANLDFGRGEDEAIRDFLSVEYLEDKNGNEIDYDGERQKLSVQEEFLPSADDDRYVFNIEGGVCAISGKVPKLFPESDLVETESKILKDVSGIDCQLHESSEACYVNKCEASLITIGSGLGDGYYRAVAFDNLLGDIECVMTYFSYNWEYVESKLIFGEKTTGTKSNGTLIGNLENQIPIYLGEIKSDGTLNFGDRWAWSEAGRDDFKIVSISVPADEYLVLGWIEALHFDPNDIRIFTVGLYRNEMRAYYLNLMEEFPVMKTFADKHLYFNRNLGDY